jgi:protein-tyrosine-phosphatase
MAWFIPLCLSNFLSPFVYKGNICRSAFAEYLMRAGKIDELLSIESCGLEVGMRTTAPFETKTTARKFVVNPDDHLSKG